LVCETVDIAGQPPMQGGCSVQFPESLAATIDLTAVPELQPFAGKALADGLSIQSIAYGISGNTLNDPFGSVSILSAPRGVTDPDDGRDQEIGFVPIVLANTDPGGMVSLENTTIYGVETPSSTFELIVSTIEVLGSLPLPSGQITLSVSTAVFE
jgi:hypothetical protein